MPQAKKQAAKKRAATKRTPTTEGAPPGPVEDNDSEETESTEATSVTDFDQQEHDERVKHNERTGGGKVVPGEVQRQRDEHNRRVGDASRA